MRSGRRLRRIGRWVVMFRFLLNFVSLSVTNRGTHQINTIHVLSSSNLFKSTHFQISFIVNYFTNSQNKIFNHQTLFFFLNLFNYHLPTLVNSTNNIYKIYFILNLNPNRNKFYREKNN